jgi:hypothetical protein
MENSHPNTQDTQEALTHEQIALMLQSPELQALIDSRAQSIATEAAKIAVWSDKDDFIPDYQTGRTGYGNDKNGEGTSVALTEDDERFLNREQSEREDTEAIRKNASSNMDMFMSNPDEIKERPLIAIVRDLAVEKSMTARRHYETKAGNISKNRKQVEAVDQARVIDLKDELAINLVTDKVSQDEKLNKLIAVQERAGLSEDEISDILESMTQYDDMLTNAANLTDEVVQNQIVPAIHELVSNNERPRSYFVKSDGEHTEEYLKASDAISKAIEIDNPVLRKRAIAEANQQLNEALHKSEAVLLKNRAEAKAKSDKESAEGQLSLEDELDEANRAHEKPAAPNDSDWPPKVPTIKPEAKKSADNTEAIEKKAAGLAKNWLDVVEENNYNTARTKALNQAFNLADNHRKGKTRADHNKPVAETDGGQALELAWAEFSAKIRGVEVITEDGKTKIDGSPANVEKFKKDMKFIEKAFEAASNDNIIPRTWGKLKLRVAK